MFNVGHSRLHFPLLTITVLNDDDLGIIYVFVHVYRSNWNSYNTTCKPTLIKRILDLSLFTEITNNVFLSTSELNFIVNYDDLCF